MTVPKCQQLGLTIVAFQPCPFESVNLVCHANARSETDPLPASDRIIWAIEDRKKTQCRPRMMSSGTATAPRGGMRGGRPRSWPGYGLPAGLAPLRERALKPARRGPVGSYAVASPTSDDMHSKVSLLWDTQPSGLDAEKPIDLCSDVSGLGVGFDWIHIDGKNLTIRVLWKRNTSSRKYHIVVFVSP